MSCANCGFECGVDTYCGDKCAELAKLRADNARLRDMIAEAGKYCVEDRATTKRTTRLARWVARAKEETKP